MSFWDNAYKVTKDIGTVLVNSITESANKIRETKEKYESKSDEELVRIVRSEGFLGNSQQEKSIAFMILKERGYPVDGINRNHNQNNKKMEHIR